MQTAYERFKESHLLRGRNMHDPDGKGDPISQRGHALTPFIAKKDRLAEYVNLIRRASPAVSYFDNIALHEPFKAIYVMPHIWAALSRRTA